MQMIRREWPGGMAAAALGGRTLAGRPKVDASPLKITGLTVTPIAIPDPPILASRGCHGPYFLRNIVQLQTDSGIVGIGETRGGESTRRALEEARDGVIGANAFAY